MLENIAKYPIILGSNSPRRKELLASMGITATVLVRETDESYDASLSAREIVTHIARQKALAFEDDFRDSLVITADTIVVSAAGRIIGKPASREEAIYEIQQLSATKHRVMTAVAILHLGKVHTFVEETAVTFYPLTAEEISYYVDTFQPYDKAGSYGIQEWIGAIGIEKLEGSYHTVVGLPTARLYQLLKTL